MRYFLFTAFLLAAFTQAASAAQLPKMLELSTDPHPVAAEPIEPAIQSEPVIAPARSGTVVATLLNMRESPSLSSRVIQTIPSDTEVSILSESDGWYQVNAGGTLGYVRSKYIFSGDFSEPADLRSSGLSCDEHTFVSTKTYYTPAPEHIIGRAVLYAPGLMEATAVYNGFDLSGFVGGVAMPTAAQLGEVVWLRRPGNVWEGPYLVVDVSSQGHTCEHVVNRHQSVEVDFPTAVRWGMASGGPGDWQILQGSLGDIEVYTGLTPPAETSTPTVYRDWFQRTAELGDGSDHKVWNVGYAHFKDFAEYSAALELTKIQ